MSLILLKHTFQFAPIFCACHLYGVSDRRFERKEPSLRTQQQREHSTEWIRVASCYCTETGLVGVNQNYQLFASSYRMSDVNELIEQLFKRIRRTFCSHLLQRSWAAKVQLRATTVSARLKRDNHVLLWIAVVVISEVCMHGDRLITRFPFLQPIFPDSLLSLNFFLFLYDM